MSTNEPDYLEFRGRDLKECEEFISAVNKQARAQGKFRDDQWIADLVGASMAGDALLWWSALDQGTQRSWRSLQQAMLLRYRLHFAGKNGAEAEHFVHWVRQRALDVGKLDDPHWAAALASGCFVGSALRWYTSLDPGIRGDWDSLQQAIFVEYGQNFQGVSWSLTVPTPAAAATAPILPRRRARGRIQVKRQDDSRVYYLSKVLNTEPDYLGRVMVTQHVVEALEVEYESIPPFDDPRTLFIPDNQIPGCDALGMKWKMTDTTAAAETKFPYAAST
ncbi:hypothetical protein M407DRAFT_31276 [Tulasnella calospora MUT 4182]|uniref:Uncharacterized protein n=1 Tax=Tulasnella calospora MUT 4182 TaxID=1051891 RepID=A0A0C3KC75_9AGAM|nr:hypothetical protein M407DRAFT_31276 [Tulasnella calospora MUT 4182]